MSRGLNMNSLSMIPHNKMVYPSVACEPMLNKPMHSLLVQDCLAPYGPKLWCTPPGCRIGQWLVHLMERLPMKWEMVKDQILQKSKSSVLRLMWKIMLLGDLIHELKLADLLGMILRAKAITSAGHTNAQWLWSGDLLAEGERDKVIQHPSNIPKPKDKQPEP